MSNHNVEARYYVTENSDTAGALYSKPPAGPLYGNISTQLIVPNVSPPAGAPANVVYGAHIWVALGTSPVSQAGIIATTVSDGSSSKTNYSAAWSWAAQNYQPGYTGGAMPNLDITEGVVVSIELGIGFQGITEGSFSHIKIDNLAVAGKTFETELEAEKVPNWGHTTETASWYVTAPDANTSSLANFSTITFASGFATTYDNQQHFIFDATQTNMAPNDKNITSLHSTISSMDPQLDITYVGPS